MVKAVFFDCDGVLIDSERFDQSLNEDFIHAYHLDIDPKVFYMLVGASPSLNLWPELYSRISGRIPWSQEEFRQKYREFRKSSHRTLCFHDILFDDVPRTLRYLKEEKGLIIACASSSPPDYIAQAMEECGIRPYFDLLVSGFDFRRSKPDPEIYQFCRDKFGLFSEECLVIEDSTYGIQAARAAGMPVLARRDTLFSMDQSGAAAVIDTLDEIRDFLNRQSKEGEEQPYANF